jgi:hypothetical protein
LSVYKEEEEVNLREWGHNKCPKSLNISLVVVVDKDIVSPDNHKGNNETSGILSKTEKKHRRMQKKLLRLPIIEI